MTGFEPLTSGIGSNRSTNSATTTAQGKVCQRSLRWMGEQSIRCQHILVSRLTSSLPFKFSSRKKIYKRLQCDQMARLFFQYVAVYNNESWLL